MFKFSAANVAVNFYESFGGNTFPNMCYATVGGHDRVYICSQDADEVQYWDWADSSSNQSAFNATRGFNCIEWAPVQGVLYVCREFQFIDMYTTGVDGGGNSPVYSGITLDTLRSTFNGVAIRYNSNDGLIYVAGGADNTVAVFNPATNVFIGGDPGSRVRAGYDLPCDFVFTGTMKFAVQQGTVPLKEVI
jgi:hypothetical protein